MTQVNTDSQPQEVSYPMVVVGFDTSILRGKALQLEQTEKFKCVLIRHVQDKVGEISMFGKKSNFLLTSRSRGADEDQARAHLQYFLQQSGTANNVKIGSVLSSCRNTPTGWIREWAFTVIRADTDSIWECGEVVEEYYKEISKPVPLGMKEQFQELRIKLIVVDQFDVYCNNTSEKKADHSLQK